jgi:hypothetical protein
MDTFGLILKVFQNLFLPYLHQYPLAEVWLPAQDDSKFNIHIAIKNGSTYRRRRKK